MEQQEWATAADKKSGRIYYYNIHTRETTWDKPIALAESEEERERMLRIHSSRLSFFREMEMNIKRKVSNVPQSLSVSSKKSANNFINNQNSIQRRLSQYFEMSKHSPSDMNLHGLLTRNFNSKSYTKSLSRRHLQSRSTFDDSLDDHLESFKRANSDRFHRDGSPEKVIKVTNSFSSRVSDSSSSTYCRQHRRCYSTGTKYNGTTICSPDNDATITCVCMIIREYMLESASKVEPNISQYEIFRDSGRMFYSRTATQTESESELHMVPSLSTIKDFFSLVFNKSQLENECVIIALIYCERLLTITKRKLLIRHDNWRSILFSCLLLASKVWDDMSMWNIDFSQVSSSFDLQRINALELQVLSELKYTLRVTASEYAKFYFYLRSMMENDRSGIFQNIGNGSENQQYLLGSLDISQVRRLQTASIQFSNNYLKQKNLIDGKLKRSVTIDFIDGSNSNNINIPTRRTVDNNIHSTYVKNDYESFEMCTNILSSSGGGSNDMSVQNMNPYLPAMGYNGTNEVAQNHNNNNSLQTSQKIQNNLSQYQQEIAIALINLKNC